MGQAWNARTKLLPSVFGSPVTDKSSGDEADWSSGLAWGFSEMQGWRTEMEDVHITGASVGSLAGREGQGWDSTAIFAVMDGHGGTQVARFCGNHFVSVMAAGPGQDPAAGLQSAFLQLDEMLADSANFSELRALSNSTIHLESPANGCGCTALICCVRPDIIVCANAGDCRAVLCQCGQAVDLSIDHKPTLPEEHTRITRAGGWVDSDGCVNGDLGVARAMGDLEFKLNSELSPELQIISAMPDVKTFPRDPQDEFILVGCDGVWDGISSQDAVNFIRERLGDCASWRERIVHGTLRLSAIVEELLDRCMSKDKFDNLSDDNMTAILIIFEAPPGVRQWNTSKAPMLSSCDLVSVVMDGVCCSEKPQSDDSYREIGTNVQAKYWMEAATLTGEDAEFGTPSEEPLAALHQPMAHGSERLYEVHAPSKAQNQSLEETANDFRVEVEQLEAQASYPLGGRSSSQKELMDKAGLEHEVADQSSLLKHAEHEPTDGGANVEQQQSALQWDRQIENGDRSNKNLTDPALREESGGLRVLSSLEPKVARHLLVSDRVVHHPGVLSAGSTTAALQCDRHIGNGNRSNNNMAYRMPLDPGGWCMQSSALPKPAYRPLSPSRVLRPCATLGHNQTLTISGAQLRTQTRCEQEPRRFVTPS